MGCILSSILGVIVKIIKFILNVVIKSSVKILSFTGLYVPFFYCLYVLFIYIIFKTDFSAPSVEATLFYVGLSVSLACAVVILFRKLTSPFRPTAQKDNRRSLREPNRQTEKPEIYWSELYPDILVHEYKDRYKLYKRKNGELRLFKIEYKDDD